MNIAGHDIGVCSWSLRPKDTADLIAQLIILGGIIAGGISFYALLLELLGVVSWTKAIGDLRG